MRDEFFRVVEELDDWMAVRSRDDAACQAAANAAVDALRSGATYEEAFERGVQTFKRTPEHDVAASPDEPRGREP